MHYFKWTRAGDLPWTPANQVTDEDVFSIKIEQAEGAFATCDVEIINPHRGLLDSDDLWVWITRDTTPLFYGRIVGVPVDITEEIVRVSFIARPVDYEEQRAALANSLKVPPYWDELWITEEERDNPDTVLEARTGLWDADRVNHNVSLNDIVTNGTVPRGYDDTLLIEGSVKVSYGQPPVRIVSIEATVNWNQAGSGEVDITDRIIKAFRNTGTMYPFTVSSITGEGLYSDWPAPQTDVGGGWQIWQSDLKLRPDLDRVIPSFIWAMSSWFYCMFTLWFFTPFMTLRYEASRRRTETALLTMRADCQDLVVDPGDQAAVDIKVSSQIVGELDTAGNIPIGDVRRSSFFKTDRGIQAANYLVALGRARLLGRARAVTIAFDVPLDNALGITCRDVVILTSRILPGGTATGKVTQFALTMGGDGQTNGHIEIACLIGNGNHLGGIAEGAPTYVDAGYVDHGYQVEQGGQAVVIENEIKMDDYQGAPIADDGIDLFNMTPDSAIEVLEVINGEASQRQIIARPHLTIQAAADDINANHTQVHLRVRNVTGEFNTTIPITVSDLMVEQGIDLGAAS